jgi:hypothetical protein
MTVQRDMCGECTRNGKIWGLRRRDVVIRLIDFDWAGGMGEAKYPIGVNKTTMRRPDKKGPTQK